MIFALLLYHIFTQLANQTLQKYIRRGATLLPGVHIILLTLPPTAQIDLFSLFWGNLLWLIYALNYILKGDHDTDFLPIISFIKIFVAEKVAKSLVEWCRVVSIFNLQILIILINRS